MIILWGKDEGRVVLKVTVRSNGLTKRGYSNLWNHTNDEASGRYFGEAKIRRNAG